MTTATHLSLRWSVSRGRETYGYNIVTLTDTSTGDAFRATGGGYDLVGTVFGAWLEKNYQAGLSALADRAYYQFFDDAELSKKSNGLYGMSAHRSDAGVRVTLNGGCGTNSMLRVAEALGLTVTDVRGRKANVTGFTVVSDVDR